MSISTRIATFFLLHGVMLSIPFAVTSMSSKADAEAARPAAVSTEIIASAELPAELVVAQAE